MIGKKWVLGVGPSEAYDVIYEDCDCPTERKMIARVIDGPSAKLIAAAPEMADLLEEIRAVPGLDYQARIRSILERFV